MCKYNASLRCLLSLIALLILHVDSIAQNVNEAQCGPIRAPGGGGYGPFDYRTATPEQRNLVEGTHFTPNVEQLKHGETAPLGGDLGYTLGVFPNNYRALASLGRLQLREKTNKLPGLRWPVECYFERGIRFAPDDPMVRQVYGNYLVRLGRKSEALTQVEKARELGSDSGNLHYNLGLLYFDLGQFDKSLEHAWKAYQLGFDLPGLKGKLKASGKWKDPPQLPEKGPQ